jgi:hypothetical protein
MNKQSILQFQYSLLLYIARNEMCIFLN